jgi:hypothetical protein
MKRRLDFTEAAEELGVKESWLRDNVKKLPHKKLGRFVYFTDADLDRIDEMHHHEPQSGPFARPAPVTSISGGHPLADLKPLPSRRRNSA